MSRDQSPTGESLADGQRLQPFTQLPLRLRNLDAMRQVVESQRVVAGAGLTARRSADGTVIDAIGGALPTLFKITGATKLGTAYRWRYTGVHVMLSAPENTSYASRVGTIDPSANSTSLYNLAEMHNGTAKTATDGQGVDLTAADFTDFEIIAIPNNRVVAAWGPYLASDNGRYFVFDSPNGIDGECA
jgi:hypothetical protein